MKNRKIISVIMAAAMFASVCFPACQRVAGDSEYQNTASGSAETVNAANSALPSGVADTPAGQENTLSGQSVTIADIENAGFETVATLIIETENGELPTYDLYQKTEAESALLGQGIINNDYVTCSVELRLGSEVQSASGRIRVRGHTSATLDKKPYKLKLDAENDFLFPGTACSSLNLMAEDGKSLNYPIAACLAGQLGVEWQPGYRYVNVFMNGEYMGLYLAVEDVSDGFAQMNIADDGYLFECDPYWYLADLYVRSAHAENEYFAYTFKGEVTGEEAEIFKQYTDDALSALYKGNAEAYLKTFDVRSFASWLLTQELLVNTDSAGSNTYLYIRSLKDDPQVRFGVVWDAFQSFASVEGTSPKFQELPTMGLSDVLYTEAFQRAFISLWYANRDCLLTCVGELLDGMDLDELAAAYRFDTVAWGNGVDPRAQKDSALAFLTQRLGWIDDNISAYTTLKFSREGDTFTVHFACDEAETLRFAVWSEQDGQDDLAWYDGCKTENGYDVTFDLKDHLAGEDRLTVHIYKGDEFLQAVTFRVSLAEP